MSEKDLETLTALAQHKSLEIYRRIFYASPDYIAFSRLSDGVFIDVNPGFEKLLGFKRDDVVGKSSAGVGMWPEDLPEQRDRFVEQLRRDGYVKDYAGILQTVTGERIEVEASANVVNIEGEDILVAIIRDVTSRNRAQRAHQDSAIRLEFILDAAQIGDWEIDLSTQTVTHRSLRHDQCFGYPEGVADWSLERFMEHLHPDDRPEVSSRFEESMRRGEDWHFEGRVIWPDQSVHWISVHASSDRRHGEHKLIGIVYDITARKEAEEAQRMADRRKDEFLAMLAHELRNPLAPITGAAQLLKMVTHNDPRVLRGAEIIERQAGHMASLMDDLLDVSRVTRGLVTLAKVRVDLKSVLSDALEQARPLLEQRHHAIQLMLAPANADVLGDRARLVQVFANLLNNAARYTPEGGRVAVRMEVGGGRASVMVEDSGIGIHGELLPRIFELFVQGRRSADRAEGGLGLGLALVKSLVEGHGGQVEARSAGPGKGACFIVHLPLLDSSGMSQAVRESIKYAVNVAPMAVMIVDDNADAASVLAMLLEGAGHRVTVMHDSAAALAAARDGHYDVFLLDIGLPGMDGNELARRLRALPDSKDALLVGITGYGQETDRQAGLAAGFDHYLVKPVDMAQLAKLLKARTRQRQDDPRPHSA